MSHWLRTFLTLFKQLHVGALDFKKMGLCVVLCMCVCAVLAKLYFWSHIFEKLLFSYEILALWEYFVSTY